MGLEREFDANEMVVVREFFDVPLKSNVSRCRDEFFRRLKEKGWMQEGTAITSKRINLGINIGTDEEGNHYLEYRAVLVPDNPYSVEGMGSFE